MQPRWQSILEAVLGTMAGFWIAVLCNAYVAPLIGVHMTLHENFRYGVLMTLVSLFRSYTFRRIFNYWHGKRQS